MHATMVTMQPVQWSCPHSFALYRLKKSEKRWRKKWNWRFNRGTVAVHFVTPNVDENLKVLAQKRLTAVPDAELPITGEHNLAGQNHIPLPLRFRLYRQGLRFRSCGCVRRRSHLRLIVVTFRTHQPPPPQAPTFFLDEAESDQDPVLSVDVDSVSNDWADILSTASNVPVTVYFIVDSEVKGEESFQYKKELWFAIQSSNSRSNQWTRTHAHLGIPTSLSRQTSLLALSTEISASSRSAPERRANTSSCRLAAR
jgi:hypothetical protein